MKRNFENAEVLLKVENLCRYFKMGKKELKAVNNVSFDIKKGEVFGLVGESGCGKTTTGRTIIRLYDATSGSVYFKGRRIVAGTRSYKDEISAEKKRSEEEIKRLKNKQAELLNGVSEQTDAEKIKEEYSALINEEKSRAENFINAKRAEMKNAVSECRESDELFAREAVEKVKEKYATLLDEAEKEPESEEKSKKIAELKKARAAELKKAKRAKLVTRIQMIYQDPIASIDPRMTVREIVSEGLVIQGERDKKVIDEKVYKMLELVGLVREHAGRYPHEFSGGQRQRIGIARSVIMEPELIIADEPVSALDVSIQAQVINLLNDLRESLGLTILFIAHDLSVVKYFSDRIGVMYMGNMVELASSDELFANPLHPYTKALLSAIPLPDPHYEKTRVRLTYNPIAEHDYSVNKPTMREITPAHFVFCNDDEEKKYVAECKEKGIKTVIGGAKEGAEKVE